MTNHTKKYKETIHTTRPHLNSFEKFASKLFHLKVIEIALSSLDKTIFRTTPLLIGLGSAVTIGIFIVVVCTVFGYQIISMTVLLYILLLGFIIGAVFEYVRALIKQSK